MPKHALILGRPRKRVVGAVLSAITAAAAVVTVALGTFSASADSAQVDGNYACAFTSGAFNCSPAPLPTVTVTETVTATPTTSSSPSPSPTQTQSGSLMTGVSSPGLGAFPTAKAVRTYWSGLPSTNLPSAPTGAALFVSFKQLPSASAFTADLAAWAASGRQVYWTYFHEADGGGLTPAAFQSGWASLLTVERAHPYANLHSVTILMAYAFQRGNVEQYYVPNVDLIGFDCYNLKAEGPALNYAAAKGKRLIFGEVGNVLNGAANTDAAALAYAKSFWGALTPNVLAAMWWSQNTNTLNGKPNTAAFLAAQ
jgi:hypothetical protein